jgi:hypothetical protein
MTLSISDMEKITYLEQNVKDLQHQVTESYKRIKDLTGTLERLGFAHLIQEKNESWEPEHYIGRNVVW